MADRRRLCVAVGIGLHLAGAAVRAAEPNFSAIAPRMQAFVDEGSVAGVVTLVADREKVLHLAAVGSADMAAGRKLKTDDVFWIASMSKPVTAVCAAILVDEGKLAFDDPVEKHLPEFRGLKVGRDGQAPQRPVTLRDLLTHTSGMGEYARTEPHWTLEEFTKQLATQPLRFQPGTRWLYSTAGTDAIGRVVEVASGMTFDQFLQKRLCEPLGMKDTSFWITPETEKRFAKAYRGPVGKLEEAPIGYMYGTAVTDRKRAPLGGAGLFSTAEDMARFYQLMLNKGTWNGKAILKPETVTAMTTHQTSALNARPGMPWGYGFSVITDPSAMEANKPVSPGTFGHGGAFGTSSWADPVRGIVYVQMLERDKFPNGNPDNSPMHIAFNQLATEAMRK